MKDKTKGNMFFWLALLLLILATTLQGTLQMVVGVIGVIVVIISLMYTAKARFKSILLFFRDLLGK